MFLYEICIQLKHIFFISVNADSSSEEFDVKDLRELNELLVEKFNISFLGDVINLVDKVKEKCPDLESKLEVRIPSTLEYELLHIRIFSKLFHLIA